MFFSSSLPVVHVIKSAIKNKHICDIFEPS